MRMRRGSAILAGICIMTGMAAQELRIGTIAGTAPYAPIIVDVLKDAGYGATVVIYPQPADLYPEVAKGNVDGAFFLAQPVIAQLGGAVMVPVRIAQTDFCAVSIDPNVKVAGPADLRKYSVGIVKDQAAHAAITRGMKTVTAANDAEQFRMLADGRIQVAISVDMAIPSYCAAAGITEYYIQKPPLLMSPTFFALSRKQGKLEKPIAAAFKQWLENGKWAEAFAAATAEAMKKD
jgi:ABC-type amino acid transport substrate-binding protein